MAGIARLLNPAQTGRDAQKLASDLRQRIVGQDDAIEQVIQVYQIERAGMANPAARSATFSSWGQPAPEKPDWWKRRPRVCSATHARSSNRLRGIPAQPRNCKADRLAPGLSRPSGNTRAAQPGGVESISHRADQDQLRALRRNRKSQRRFVASAARRARQGNTHTRRQSPRGLFTRTDLHDQQSGRGRNERDRAPANRLRGVRIGSQGCDRLRGLEPHGEDSRARASKRRGGNSVRSS